MRSLLSEHVQNLIRDKIISIKSIEYLDDIIKITLNVLDIRLLHKYVVYNVATGPDHGNLCSAFDCMYKNGSVCSDIQGQNCSTLLAENKAKFYKWNTMKSIYGVKFLKNKYHAHIQ